MNARSVRLVARREVRTRGRARSYRIMMILSMAGVAAGVIVPHALKGQKGPLHLGVVGQSVPVQQLEAAVGRTIVVSTPASAAAARAEVDAKQLDLAVIGEQVVTRTAPKPTDTGATSRLAETLASVLAARAAGLTPSQVATLANPDARIAATVAAKPDRTHQQVTTLIGIILLFTSIQAYGTWILFGVVEEKSSRVVEILLATLDTSELLAGKVLGIGTLAILQVVMLAVTAFAASAAVGSNVLHGASGTTVLELVGWVILGYSLYSCLYAAGGSLVGRQEEAQNVTFPILLPLLVAYIASEAAIFGSPSSFVVALSYIPLTAPVAMPARMASGNLPVWQPLLAVALILVGIVVAVRLASRVYDRAILRTGGRITWRTALRSPGV